MSGIKNIKKKLKGFLVRPPNAEVIKKVLLHIPYVVVFYVVNKCTWLYQYCRGSTVVDRLMVLLMNYPLAFKKLLPSIQPKSLAAGTIAAVSVWAGVYFKGKNGKKFKIYKFRSMRLDAEKFGPALYKGGADPRMTRVGKFLRVHHLDELPQLWNVFVGDMSFIGPRPERKFYIDQIMERDPRYRYLYQIRPGVTSYATLYNGYTDTVDKMLRRLRYDLFYLEHRSWLFDFKILVKTFLNIAFGKKF